MQRGRVKYLAYLVVQTLWIVPRVNNENKNYSAGLGKET